MCKVEAHELKCAACNGLKLPHETKRKLPEELEAQKVTLA